MDGLFLIGTLFVLIALGVPVAYSLGLAVKRGQSNFPVTSISGKLL